MKKTLIILVIPLLALSVFIAQNNSASAASSTHYWNFDEGSGNTANDQVGTEHGTIYGATWNGSGISGDALNFDGTDDYVAVPGGTDAFSKYTISLWFNANSLSGRQFLYQEGGNDNGINVYLLDNKLYAGVYSETNGFDGQWVEHQNNVTSGWHFVAVVYDSIGHFFQIYMDGVRTAINFSPANIGQEVNGEILTESGVGTEIYRHVGDASIGSMRDFTIIETGEVNNPGVDYFFDGIIDDVKLYHEVAISMTDVTNEYNAGQCSEDTWTCGDWSECSEAGEQTRTCEITEECAAADTPSPDTTQECDPPVTGHISYWSFDEGSGTIAADSIGDYDATISGATWTDDARSGNALSFDGIDDFLEIDPYAKQFEKYSIEAWFEANDLTSRQIIFEEGGGPNTPTGINLYIYDGYLWAGVFSNVGPFIMHTTPLTDGWHYAVVVYDSVDDKFSLYLDGEVEEKLLGYGGSIAAPQGPRAIGSAVYGTRFETGQVGIDPREDYFFNGIIDEVKVHRQIALSASEVESNYNQCTEDIWSCGDWGDCSSSGEQTRTCEITNECAAVDTPSPDTTQSCDPSDDSGGSSGDSTPSCTEDTWTCGTWSECSNAGVKTRSCEMTVNCSSVSTPSPDTSLSCTPPGDDQEEDNQSNDDEQGDDSTSDESSTGECAEDTWTCGEWSACSVGGQKTRSCLKTADCAAIESTPPLTIDTCTPGTSDDSNSEQNITIINIIIDKLKVDIKQYAEDAGQIINNVFIGTERDENKEGEADVKYTEKIIGNHSNIKLKIKNLITNFITYGSPTTVILGEGERAGVVNSYQDAFGELPEDESDWEDVVKIANGRWPGKFNKEKEDKMKKDFKRIYLRQPNKEDPNDDAALTVMTYGLRPADRNLNSERQAIKIFRDIYDHKPESASDWDIVRAIAYSGAIRGEDSDSDLLIDSKELELGTDPNNPDTDGDGYMDGIEVINGYDPLIKKD